MSTAVVWSSDSQRLLRLGGLALLAAIGLLAFVPGPREGVTLGYALALAGPLIALGVIDLLAPGTGSPIWQRILCLGAELVLAFLVVRAQGTLIRPALVYLLPASRALLMFGERSGLAASLTVWLAYGGNIALSVWPDRLSEYPNYLSFFLAPYVLAIVFTLTTLREIAARRHTQTLYDELRNAHEQLQLLHGKERELAVTEERNRLAREIHDSLAHYLTVINIQLEAAERLGASRAEEAIAHARRARRLAVDCLQDVRRSVGALRAASLEELSLAKSLDQLITDFSESTGIAVERDIEPSDPALPPEIALACYRAVQEGLTNVQRHAHARRARLSIRRTAVALEINVEDDGIGPPAHNRESPGFGIAGLRERVALLDGTVSLERASSGGARLSVTLKLPDGK